MRNNKGFTLIELLLVVVIIGLMLAVIVPRAWRANIDAKYGLVRQNCSELSSFAQEWAQGQQDAQDASTSTATTDDYFSTLCGNTTWSDGLGMWIADESAANNWTNTTSTSGGTATANRVTVTGRYMPGDATTSVVPEAVVEDIIPPEKVLRNPFNESSVFQTGNDPSQNNSPPIPGAIAITTKQETAGNPFHYYAFLFQGTDSTTTTITDATSFYAGQDTSDINGLRNGVFMARL